MINIKINLLNWKHTFQEAEKREAAARAQIIEEERQKLLDEHAQF